MTFRNNKFKIKFIVFVICVGRERRESGEKREKRERREERESGKVGASLKAPYFLAGLGMGSIVNLLVWGILPNAWLHELGLA